MRLLAPLLLLASACSDDDVPPPASRAADVGTIVVGLTSDLAVWHDIAQIHVVMRVDERVLRDDVVTASAGLAFPTEFAFRDVAAGSTIDINIEAVEAPYTPVLVTRRARTRVLSGRELLLRARLEWECIPEFQLSGNQTAPRCAEPDTCIAASCVDPFVAPELLEPYVPDWSTSFADACRSLDPGAPLVLLGQGSGGFEPLTPGGALFVEPGPQGGSHVWLGVRMRNLHRQGSLTHLSARTLEDDDEIFAVDAPFAYVPVTDGLCELRGLLCQLRPDLWPHVAELYGKSVRVDARVVDPTGEVGFGSEIATLKRREE